MTTDRRGFIKTLFLASADHEVGNGPVFNHQQANKVQSGLEALSGGFTLAELRAFNETDIIRRIRVDGSWWDWDESSTDPENTYLEYFGTVVKKDGASIGRWLREFKHTHYLAAWWGVKPDGAVNDQYAKLQAAADAAGDNGLYINDGSYRIDGDLTISGRFFAQDARLYYYGAYRADLIRQTLVRDVIGITLDASNVDRVRYGLFVNCNSAQERKAKYRLNINSCSNSNSAEGCLAAFFNKNSGESSHLNPDLDISINVDGVLSVPNGVVGDSGGSSRGIYVSIRSAGAKPRVKIHDCVVKNIFSVEDGDAVHIADSQGAESGRWTIQRVDVENADKRCFKIQASNAIVKDCNASGQGGGYDTYADNTLLDNCSYNGGSVPFFVNHSNARIKSCHNVFSSWPALIEVNPDATNTIINGFTGETAYVFPENSTAASVKLFNKMQLNNVSIKGAGNDGSAFAALGGAVDVVGDNVKADGFNNGLFASYCSGVVNFSRFKAVNVKNGFNRIGGANDDYSFLFILDLPHIEATSYIGIASNGTSFSRVQITNGINLSGGNGGILVRTGSNVQNNNIKKTGSVGGTGLSLGNLSKAVGNTVSGFNVGISYPYATSATVIGNDASSCATPYLTTGRTIYNEANNV